jgi:uncharacterized membrane protein
MKITLLLLFYFAVPIIWQWAATRAAWIDKVGVVTLCYITGILFGNLPGIVIPEVFGETFMSVVVGLSIPLLLFSSDYRVWRKLGPALSVAFLGCVISVCIAAVIGTWLFRDMIPDVWQFASMLIGVFTGMTVNMFAVGMSLGVTSDAFMVLNGAEMLFGGLYLLFLLTVAKRMFSKVLPAKIDHKHEVTVVLDEKVYWKTSPLALILSAIILAIAYGLSLLINRDGDNYHTTTIFMLTITTLGILGSLISRIRNIKGSFGIGNYLMYVFCVAVGSHADVSKVLGAAPVILVFVFTMLTMAVLLHCLFCRLFRIDVDAFLLSSTAGIQGPPFIAPVTKALGNQGLIPVGIALALLGLTLGNYIGVGVSYLLRLI